VTTASLVACGKSKVDTESVAWQLYNSTGFEKNWTAGMLCGDPYVMSAEHGLVLPQTRVEPYDTSLYDVTADERLLWGRDVVADLPNRYDTVVLFGGRKYVDPIITALDDDSQSWVVYDPFVVTTGNGQQMRVADRIADARTAGKSVSVAVEHGMEPYVSP